MIAKCQTNNIAEIPNDQLKARLSKWIPVNGPICDLSVGRSYHVVGLTRWKDGGLWIYVHTVEEDGYPYPYPIELFEIVDGSLPTSWVIKFASGKSGSVIQQAGFPEWIPDESFYEKLIDGDEAALALYKQQRTLLNSWPE